VWQSVQGSLGFAGGIGNCQTLSNDKFTQTCLASKCWVSTALQTCPDLAVQEALWQAYPSEIALFSCENTSVLQKGRRSKWLKAAENWCYNLLSLPQQRCQYQHCATIWLVHRECSEVGWSLHASAHWTLQTTTGMTSGSYSVQPRILCLRLPHSSVYLILLLLDREANLAVNLGLVEGIALVVFVFMQLLVAWDSQ
jgi:hypothetical protein